MDASDVLDVIVKAITEPGMKAEEEEKAATTTQNHTQPTNNTTNGGRTAGSNGGTNGGSGGGLNITEGLETPEKDITPKAVTVGSTKIIADPRENTIIVLGNDEVKQKIFTLLDQLDVRAPQVMLNTVIGEYTLNNDSNVGVDYLLHYPSGPLANLLSASPARTEHAGQHIVPQRQHRRGHHAISPARRCLDARLGPRAPGAASPRPSARRIRWT